LGLPHCSQATERGASTFQAALRERVRERDIFFLGTAISALLGHLLIE
jgi:hypothetical protein